MPTLEIAENAKPANKQRKILPPAIQISASGRMVRMHQEEFKQAKLDLISLIEWAGRPLLQEMELRHHHDYQLSKNRPVKSAHSILEQSNCVDLLVRSFSAHHNQGSRKVFFPCNLVNFDVCKTSINHCITPFFD